MEVQREVYTIKGDGPPKYYLGNDFKKDKKRCWCIGSKKYLKEAISQMEAVFGTLVKSTNPMIMRDYPKLDDSSLLTDNAQHKYQMLIGMLVWIIMNGHLDISYATMLMSRFVAAI